MEEIRLEPCPFCGKNTGEVTTAKELEYCKKFEEETCPCFDYGESNCYLYTVVCNYHNGGCGATSGYFTDRDKAIMRWNRRNECWRDKDMVTFMEERGLG